MKAKFGLISIFAVLLTLVCGSPSSGQQSGPGDQASTTGQSTQKDQKDKNKRATSSGKEIGGGAKDIGKGAGKGAESIGKGTAGAAGDLATLHPVDAGESLGKGAGGLGKDVGVGSVKGTAKIGKGVGGEFKKLGKKAVGDSDKHKVEN